MNSMISNSIRWRLSFTYGAISLLASICLGAILLFALQRSYQQQEYDYLLQNGRTIGRILYDFYEAETDQAIIESQIDTFAFLTQTRIELLTSNKELIYDSGSPDEQNGILTLGLQVVTSEGTQAFTQNLSEDRSAYDAEILIENGSQSFRSVASVSGNGGLAEEFFTPLHLVGDPADSGIRSDQEVIIGLITDEEIGVLGRDILLMSEGPAYGRAIVTDVALGLVIAGGIATVLTSLFGWWLSGRLVQPLDELAEVSQQMGQGNLAVRSKIEREDEIGRVAVSFNQMAERVNGTVSSLRRFVADAAHEINTPITALKGNLELLESDVPDEQSHLLSQALDQTGRIQTLSADLLQLSELDGAVPIEMEELDLQALIAEQNERIAAEAEQASIKFSPQLPTEPVLLNGHAPSLLSLYQNLIDNALKFTPVGGKIDVALNSDLLAVTDTGIGLNGDTELIFDRFYRSPKAAAYPGNGLGLAIGAKIAEQHGGTLTAESQEGTTTFTFKFARKRR